MVLFIYVFSGSDPKKIFNNEQGVHSWHRVPPTEKKGRVHTSSITVVILEDNNYKEKNLSTNEVKIETTRGQGPGGQHRNTTDSTVVITHESTGIKVVRNGRCQHKNKAEALIELTKRVNEFYRCGHNSIDIEHRRGQIGNGERSDKRRTYRVKDNSVSDHITNKTASLKEKS
jgi:peptide chain release factor 1